MENKKFEVGQFWEDSDGDKNLICDVDDAFIYTFCFADKEKYEWNLDGSIADDDSYFLALTEPWQEPRSGEVWVNVYEKDDGTIYAGYAHFTKQDIDPVRKAIATIKMPWKEGQFDE